MTTEWIADWPSDVRFAVRQLKASPGFAAVAAITLALGIGANSAMFALADATLLRPLPFHDPDRLVLILERGAQQQRSYIAPLNVRDWAAQSRTFEAMEAAYVSPGDGGPTLMTSAGTPETVVGQQVTPGFFDLLGVRPIAGRTFRAEDERAKADVVVLSEAFWRTRFGGDLSLVGRAITLDGRPTTVVGIVPADFHFQRAAGLWRLLPTGDAVSGRRLRFNLQVIGRLKPGVTIDAARADLTPLADGLARQYGDERVGRYLTITPLRDALIGGELRVTSLLFLGVVGFVLLMCCANVANLLLARATSRARELALRSALGAGRGRIVVQWLTESLVLAAIGGALGIWIGAAILAVAPSFMPPDLLPGAITLAFDGRVIAFCAATTLLVGVLFGVVPAWQATGQTLTQALTSDTRTSTSRGGTVRQLLVTAEIAAAVMLLCGAGLLLRTLLTLEALPRGYGADAESVLTTDVTLPESKYPTPESILRFLEAVEDEVLALPGVRNAGWATTMPLGNAQIGTAFQVVGEPLVPPDDRPAADLQIVSPTYFDTLRLPIVSGRGFSKRDTAQSIQVCIVNEAFVRRHLAGRDPLGIRLTLWTNVVCEVVGVARQVNASMDEEQDLAQVQDMVQIYVPNAQQPHREGYLAVSANDGRGAALANAVRAAFARVDREQPIRSVVTLAQIAGEATSRHRFRAVMVMTFAGLALLLAMVGVFGVVAYSVQQRTREFGVRIALGATTARVMSLVFSSAARVIVPGIAIGLALALAFAQTVSTFLFGVPPWDPATFVSVTLVLATTAALACAVPALRAAQVDPVVAFKSE